MAADLAPTSKNFWLRLQYGLVSLKLKNIVLLTQLYWYTSRAGLRGATGAIVPVLRSKAPPVMTSTYFR